jgi:hypothetical protein
MNQNENEHAFHFCTEKIKYGQRATIIAHGPKEYTTTLFKSTGAIKTNLKRQVKPKFRWLSSQQDPVKIQL